MLSSCNSVLENDTSVGIAPSTCLNNQLAEACMQFFCSMTICLLCMRNCSG
jgi:hypothetical protein